MYTMTTQELIEELAAWQESTGDTATAQILDNAIDRLARLQRIEAERWHPIDTVPTRQKVLLWSPEYGAQLLQLDAGMNPEEVRQFGYTHWMPIPVGPMAEVSPGGDG